MSVEMPPIVKECYRDAGFTFVDRGFDSLVYKNENIVRHVYVGAGTPEFPAPSSEKLKLYFNVTNRAHLLGKDGQFVFKFPYTKGEYLFEVNPFLKMDKCMSCGFVEADSVFIGGKTLEEQPEVFDQRELRVVLSAASFYFNEKLGVNGINLVPKNLKSPKNGLIVVTDLCANIPDLRLTTFV